MIIHGNVSFSPKRDIVIHFHVIMFMEWNGEGGLMCLQKVIKDGVIENAVDYENIVPHCGLYNVISYLFVGPMYVD